jgi:hypothetical protein
MIDRNLKKRVAELERRLPLVAENQLDKKIGLFFEKYGVTSVEDFAEALANKDRLDDADSNYLQELRDKGGIADLKEVFRLMGEIYGEGSDAPAGPDRSKAGP